MIPEPKPPSCVQQILKCLDLSGFRLIVDASCSDADLETEYRGALSV